MILNLGFLTEGKLTAILITPSSWGSQWAGHSPRIKLIFWRRCRGLEEEEAPTSTILSHINYAPARAYSAFLRQWPWLGILNLGLWMFQELILLLLL
jgi:hypothetical protein